MYFTLYTAFLIHITAEIGRYYHMAEEFVYAIHQRIRNAVSVRYVKAYEHIGEAVSVQHAIE